MQRRTALLALPVLFTMGALTLQESRRSQDPMKGMDQQKMMEMYMKAAAPAKEHKKLAKLAGTWDTEAEVYMDPSKPPQKTRGKATMRMILGGRYLVEELEGEMMGMKMQGRMTLGFDNATKEYVSTWIDNMATGIYLSRGKKGADGKLVLKGTMRDVMSPQGRPFKVVSAEIDADTHTIELFDTMPGVGEFRVMKTTYRRRK
ncbi:MAG: DUF1579 domain-containing protein [Planctomycetota bacterium]